MMMMDRRIGSFCGVLGAEGVSSSLVSSLHAFSFFVCLVGAIERERERDRQSKMELKKIVEVLQ